MRITEIFEILSLANTKFCFLILSFVISTNFSSQGVVTIVSDAIYYNNGTFSHTNISIVTAGCASNITIDEDLCDLPGGNVSINIYDDSGNSNLISFEAIDQNLYQNINCEPDDTVLTWNCPSSLMDEEEFLVFSCFPPSNDQLGKIILTSQPDFQLSPCYSSYQWTSTVAGFNPSGSSLYDLSELGFYSLSIMTQDGNATNYFLQLENSSTPYQYFFYFDCFPVGMDEFIENPINIYPNPVQKNLVISNLTPDIYTLIIYDNSAKIIRSLNLNNHRDVIELDVNDLSTGIYYLRLFTNHQNHLFPFIKK